MQKNKNTGLIAAAFSPMNVTGGLDLDKVPALVDKLISDGVAGIFVCGSTGEGPSLSGEERKRLAETFVRAVGKRISVFVHVGHNSLEEARSLAAHAQEIGADYVSATPPAYFKLHDVSVLTDVLAVIAEGAPDLPFYYYHIPSLTGVDMDMRELLVQADKRIPNLVGIKYTTPQMHEYQACLSAAQGRYDILYGTDEMMLSALATGAQGFIGSTYNFAVPLYRQLIDAFEKGDMDVARRLQSRSVDMVRVIVRHGGLSAQKAMMGLLDMDCGPVRLPLRALHAGEIDALKKDLQDIGFFDPPFVHE